MEILASWHSYPHIYNLGHRYLNDLLNESVLIEEKVDGSQFSFGRFDGELRCRSKGAQLNIIAPEKMFAQVVENVNKLDLHNGWTYRGELLNKPKHGVLAYDRIPNLNVIIFDINTGEEAYLNYADKYVEASRLGLEIVPLLHNGKVDDVQLIRDLLETVSCLGGQKVEGVVIKNYARFGLDKKALMGKFVSEKFKEVHNKEWKQMNPGQGDILNKIILKYKTQARWQKALQHLKERGLIVDEPRDIGLLLKEVWPDVMAECKEEIMEELWKWAKDNIRRGVTAGLPEWYKQLLLEKQFDNPTDEKVDEVKE